MNHRVNFGQFKLCTDIEKKPGPSVYVDATKTINAPYCQGNVNRIARNVCSVWAIFPPWIHAVTVILRGGGGEETRSGTAEKRCSHNLQSGHPAWWSADSYSIFPTVNILEARIEANQQRKSEKLKNLKKLISCNFVFLAYRICLLVLKCGGN